MKFRKIIAGAFFYVLEHRRVLVKALAIPFIVYLAIDAATLLELHPAISWSLAIPATVVQAIFAITTHRVVLLGPNSVSTWGITSWSKRETYFILHVIGLVLLMMPFALLGLIPIVGSLIALVLICWIAGRLSLVFPGIAVDKGVSFKLSWEMTEKHQMLMLLVVIIFPALLAVPTILLYLVPYTFFLSSLIDTLVIVFQVAALSMAYQLISDDFYSKETTD